MKVMDAQGAVLGRLGTRVAKELLSGEQVALVNSGEAVITGNPEYIVQKYTLRRSAKNKANPEHSPKWPRRPDLLVKRIIRGMLPFRRARGRNAYKNLKVYIGHPEGIGEAQKVPGTESSGLKTRFMTINELCKNMGYKVGR
jgi:large subunit ribosomal protein L13